MRAENEACCAGEKQASVLTLPVLSGGRATRTSRESGTRMYGTIYGATCVGGAYSFDGIDDYIEIVMPENISFVGLVQKWVILGNNAERLSSIAEH